MNSGLSFIAILYILGAGQGAFLAISLLTTKVGSHIANRYLAVLTLVFTAALIDYFLDLTELTVEYPYLRTLLWPKEFLYGTLIYFYVRELTKPGEYAFTGKQYLHFVPSLIHILITWPILLLSHERQNAILSGDGLSYTSDKIMSLLLGDIELTVVIIQISIYLALSFHLLRQHSQHIQQNFSYDEKVNLRWLNRLLIGIFIVYLVWLLEELVSEWLNLETTFDTLLGTSMVVLIYSMGYLGLRQPVIFKPKQTLEQKQTKEQDASEKYKHSPLTTELSGVLHKELTTYMDSQKPYLDNQLSLPQLAKQLGISTHYLSQTINEQCQQNFFDFINRYRVEEAKSRLVEHSQQRTNILNIAMDSGFNSKSAFYTAFKKHTDMTPTQFKKTA